MSNFTQTIDGIDYTWTPVRFQNEDDNFWYFVLFNEVTREYSLQAFAKYKWKPKEKLGPHEIPIKQVKKFNAKGKKSRIICKVLLSLSEDLLRMTRRDYKPIYPTNAKTRLERQRTKHDLHHKSKPDKDRCPYCNPDLPPDPLDYVSPEHIAFHIPVKEHADGRITLLDAAYCKECALSWEWILLYKAKKVRLADILNPEFLANNVPSHSEDCDCSKCIPTGDLNV